MLNATQRTDYERDGFLVVRGLFSLEEAEYICDGLPVVEMIEPDAEMDEPERIPVAAGATSKERFP